MKSTPSHLVILLTVVLALVPCATGADEVTGAHSYAEMMRLRGAPTTRTRSLDDALVVLRARLQRDGKGKYLPLVTRPAVLSALWTSAKTYEGDMGNLGPALVPKYKYNVALMRQIAAGGAWPKGSFFDVFYTLHDENGVVYDGIGVRLVVMDTADPDRELIGSSWPIVDVWYGRG
ncbi:MAG TPA: hypothetical protein VGK19_18570 [Capsulimonadaceae bacterium]|jgi:hypothetical protein